MRHRADAGFWEAYDSLPEAIRQQADKAFELMKKDPHHPSVRLKKVGTKWSARVSRKYRAVALETDDGLLWIWIGSHAEYDRIIES